MSVSIYYQFNSKADLAVNGELAKVEQEWYVEFEQEPYENWCWYEPELDDGSYLYQGATKLPLGDPDEAHQALIIALTLLTNLRNSVDGFNWSVNLDDYDIPWDEDQKIYFLE